MTTLRNTLLRGAVAAALTLPLAAAAQMTPGMYEYTIKISIPGGPGNMPPQTSQRCLGAKDLEGNKAYQMPQGPGSDCQVKDLKESGGKFSYTMACTKPQKLDGNVQGSMTPTSMNMDMTMTMEGMPGPMTQSITAKRTGDCKPS
jgi:hypothetical protein